MPVVAESESEPGPWVRLGLSLGFETECDWVWAWTYWVWVWVWGRGSRRGIHWAWGPWTYARVWKHWCVYICMYVCPVCQSHTTFALFFDGTSFSPPSELKLIVYVYGSIQIRGVVWWWVLFACIYACTCLVAIRTTQTHPLKSPAGPDPYIDTQHTDTILRIHIFVHSGAPNPQKRALLMSVYMFPLFFEALCPWLHVAVYVCVHVTMHSFAAATLFTRTQEHVPLQW